jgi:hypothetical protein
MWHILFSPMAGRIDQSFLLALLLNQTARESEPNEPRPSGITCAQVAATVQKQASGY